MSDLGAIAGYADPKRAREYYTKAAKLDPENIPGLMWHAEMEQDAGELVEAERAYDAVLKLGVRKRDDYDLLWASLGLGDIHVARGDLPSALNLYREASSNAERLADANPGNAKLQRSFSVANSKVGDVLAAQGNLPEALKVYRDRLAIAERLAKSKPGNAELQRDLSYAYDSMGDVLKEQGNLPEALKAYSDSLAIRERLAKSNPSNGRWQRDLSVSYITVGDVLQVQGNLPAALKAYSDSLAISEGLAKTEPGNAVWQNDLSVLYERVGEALIFQGKLSEALKAYRDSQAIRERLAKTDPSDTRWQRNLSVAYEKIGDVLVAQDNLPEALRACSDSLAIAERLSKSDPGNAEWQRNLSISYLKVGDVLVAQDNLPEALNAYSDSLAIDVRLAKTEPGNAGWQRGLSISYIKVGDALREQGNLPEALKAYRDGVTIAQRLAESNPGNAQWQVDLAFSYQRFAKYGDKRAENWRKVVDILQRLDSEGRLAPVHRKWLDQAKAQIAALEEPSPYDKARAAIEAAFKADDFAKAAALQTELAAAVEKAEAEKNGKARPLAAQQQGLVSWYRLFTREFGKALKASERGLALAPGELWMATNRAHALMFLGRAKEARAAYLEHKGKDVAGQGVWEEVVPKDFAEFEKRGLTHQQMAEIRRLLAPAPPQQWGTAVEKTQNGLGGAR